MAIVWDAPAQTIRQQEYAEYKANRPSIPDDFRQQIPLIKKYCIWA
jgi:5'-3' exonuclease